MSPDLIVKRQRASLAETTIVVSKAVSKKAVVRNRIRRIIKEALRAINLEQNLKVIVAKDVSNLKMQEVRKKLQQLLKGI